MDARGGRGKGAVAAKRGDKRPFYVALSLLLVGGIGTLSYMSVRPSGSSYMDTTVTPIPNQGHVIGSDSAVEVIEFGDFECPACGSFANLTEPDVRARLALTGQVRFRFMDFPLQMHGNTWPAHMAAWCAGEQGKYWEMHDAIFLAQDRWSTGATRRPERVLADLARRVGVGMEQYDTCMRTGKYRPQIQANADEGVRLGVGSTPTFIFGSKRIATAIPYDEFKAHVDTLLAAARAARPTKAATKTK